ncbi:hypothetical protein T459_20095 [Capsicum annuum]|uniref:Uncharacterized protein n=1 Tax=Capsicum annuum TaxID=4072 RepID=A0A2G2Z3M2_CAPAN|nr:hypothetical protein T459_20095 [Capsicum annuum]
MYSTCVDMCEVEIISTTTVTKLALRNAYDRERTWMHFINRFPLLEKLVIDGFNNKSEVEITSMATVRYLKFLGVNVPATTLVNFINKFHLLDKLVIQDCFRNVQISHRHLTSFVLKNFIESTDFRAVTIDAPKLKSFGYTGCITVFPGIEASPANLELVYFH